MLFSAIESANVTHRTGMSFWRPGDAAPPTAVDRDAETTVPVEALFGHSGGVNIQRRSLPIFEYRTALLYSVETFGCTVVVGETGCGKSTQLPQYLHEAGWTDGGFMLAVTQPRRIAAMALAARVAEEMGVELGAQVGYAVRFDEKWHDSRTRIKYQTDGMLLREMMSDPLLSRYSAVIVDEAHERSLHTDVLLGLLKKVRRARPELRLVVASATLEAERFRDFFDDGGISSSGAGGVSRTSSDGARARPSSKRARSMAESGDSSSRVYHCDTDDDEDDDGPLIVEGVIDSLNSELSHNNRLVVAGGALEANSTSSAASGAAGTSQLEGGYAFSSHVDSSTAKRLRANVPDSESRSEDASGLAAAIMAHALKSLQADAAVDALSSRSNSAPVLPAANVLASTLAPKLTSSGRVSRWGPVVPPTATAAATAPAAAAPHHVTNATAHPVAPSAALDVTTTTAAAAGAADTRFLSSARIIAIEGRTFPVDIEYVNEPVSDYVTSAAETVLALVTHAGASGVADGDVLVFLPGAEEVERCCDLIREHYHDAAAAAAAAAAASTDDSASSSQYHSRKPQQQQQQQHLQPAPLEVLPLYAALPAEAQLAAVSPGHVGKDGRVSRRVIVATNIAETSLTLPGVVAVVDSGFVKMPVYDPITGVDALLTLPVSRAAASQRAGRAGRVRRGKCFRLWTEAAQSGLVHRTPPEMQRSDVTPAILLLLALRVPSVARFEYLDPPAPEAAMRALELLAALGAVSPYPPAPRRAAAGPHSMQQQQQKHRGGKQEISGGGGDSGVLGRTAAAAATAPPPLRLTRRVGRALADLPTDPRTGGMLLASLSTGCAETALTVAAMSAVSHVFTGWRPGAPRSLCTATDAAVRAFAVREGDTLTLLNAYRGYEVSGRSVEWAHANCVNPAALARAAQIRGQLRSALAALVSRDNAASSARSTNSSSSGSGSGSGGGRGAGSARSTTSAAYGDAYASDDDNGDDTGSSVVGAPWSLQSDAGLRNSGGTTAGSGSGEDDPAQAANIALRMAIAAGFFTNAARLGRDGTHYITVKEQHVASLHPSSIYAHMPGATLPPWIVFGEAVWTTKLLLRDVTAINPTWLLKIAPHMYGDPGRDAVQPFYLRDVKPASAATAAAGSSVAPPPALPPAKLQYKTAAARRQEREEADAAAAAEAASAAASAADAAAAAAKAAAASSSSSSTARIPPSAGSGLAGLLGSIFGEEAVSHSSSQQSGMLPSAAARQRREAVGAAASGAAPAVNTASGGVAASLLRDVFDF